ncbi:MAG: SDR family oxidoreductase [Candidatus Kapaibacterium sp.]|jgi:NAD(P)-dependent dehydrogenase (short-subunit alcohol dehydrogenase family)|nr:SDR family oxidoreductase [Candidatus Kapabacteria bacterium]
MNRNNALILGVSSGFGKSTALELAKRGFNIYGAHLDLGSAKIKAEELRQEVEGLGVQAVFFNTNIADENNRKNVIDNIKSIFNQRNDESVLGVFLHSVAFGALGPFIDENQENQITQKKLEMSVNVMSNSLMYWAQDLFHAQLFGNHSRILAMSSNGARVATNKYGSVSVAKAALEAIIRQLAFELAPYHITANSIMAGATETPASAKIPDFHKMLKFAKEHNPFQRNTVPEDASKVIGLLAGEEADWISGQVINVDGGQSLFTYLPDYYG